jgi:hypothetical protein
MIQELDGYENEFQIVERKFLSKENAQNNKIEILEMEKKNLQGRLEYFQKLYPSVNQSQNKIFLTDSDRIKEENLVLIDKLSIYQNFYKELENILLKKTTCINVIKNLDSFAIRFRCEEIITELNKYIKERFDNNRLKNALKLNNAFSLKLKEKKKEMRKKNFNENENEDNRSNANYSNNYNTVNNTNNHSEIQNSKYIK